MLFRSYVAEFTNNSTSGFMMKSGRRVFYYGRGTYSPVISDGRRIYLTGYSSITALQPYKYKGTVSPAIVAPQGKPEAKARSRPEGAAAPAAGSEQKRGRPGGAGRR